MCIFSRPLVLLFLIEKRYTHFNPRGKVIMEKREIFADRLRKLREKTKKTQKQFADLVESTPATISAYENATKNPSLEVVMNIADKCHVSLDWLCGLTDQEISLDTCSDILKILFEIGLLDGIGLDKNFAKMSDTFSDFHDQTYQNFMMIYFNDTTINDALEKWKKMFDLYQNKTIDEEVYRLWVEKTLREYNFPYHPNGGVRSEYNGDDYDGDNELPFN